MIGLAALALATDAGAQSAPESTRLFEQGRALAKQGKHAEACERFAQSLALERAPGTALNRGDCLEKLGQLVEARALFDEAAGELGASNDPRARFARARRDALTARLVTVELAVADPELAGLELEVGGVAVAPRASAITYALPGDLEITARAPGHVDVALAETGAAGQRLVVELPALELLVVAPRRAGGIAAGRQRRLVYGALGAGALGVAALGVGGLLGASASALQDDAIATGDCARIPAGRPDAGRLGCNPAGAAALERAGTRADAATVLAIGGGVLVTGAVVLYLTAHRERVVVVPAVTNTSVGVAVTAAF